MPPNSFVLYASRIANELAELHGDNDLDLLRLGSDLRSVGLNVHVESDFPPSTPATKPSPTGWMAGHNLSGYSPESDPFVFAGPDAWDDARSCLIDALHCAYDLSFVEEDDLLYNEAEKARLLLWSLDPMTEFRYTIGSESWWLTGTREPLS
jgi:hypothetical protein